MLKKGSSQFIAFLTLSLSVLISSNLFAQVSGILTDQATNKPIAKAEVFINNTSLATVTGDQGEFQLNGIAPGFAELVIYKDGYSLFRSSLRIQADKSFKLNLTLTPVERPKASKVKQDDDYKKNMQWFERGLFGTTTNTVACKITNIKALSLIRNGDVIHGSASEPLIIENAALGYRIKYYLQDFDAGVEDVNIQNALKFDTMSTRDYTQRETWKRNRLKAYWGSPRHLFYTLMQGTASQEGFELTDAQGNKLRLDTMTTKGRLPGYTKIKLSGRTQIRYYIANGNSGIEQTDKNGQISWVTPKESVEVSQDGLLFSKKSIEVAGYWGQMRLADMVPDNYFPTASLTDEKTDWQNFALLREKAYLHTDRDYYYPRENIWFKAYMGYSRPILRDTLSRTLYVELFSPEKKMLQSKVYRINKGVCWGDFKLPDSLAAGEYYLRAYTNWMRNYGDSALFVKPIPVLSYQENLEAVALENTSAKSDYTVRIKPTKNDFKQRERVEMQVEVVDKNGKSVPANVSVSVTDAYAAVPLSGNTILTPKSLKIPTDLNRDKYFDQIENFMERGLSFKAVVKDDKDKPVPADVEIIQGNMENLISMETDDKGEFLVTGLNFTDSMNFAFKPKTKKGKELKKVQVLAYERPEFVYAAPKLNLKMRKDNALQRVQNSFIVGDDAILLDEVEVKAKRITAERQEEQSKVYGTPDYTVKGDMLRTAVAGNNLLVGLQGKVPGLTVTQNVNGTIAVKVRGGTSSLAGGGEPLFLVDGIPFPDAASIGGIDPTRVDRVEVITRAVAQFGSRGSAGVIAIYTKQGTDGANGERNYLAHKMAGYNVPRVFSSPDYSLTKEENADFRTTVYWKPSLATENTSPVIFYTTDMVGEYRIVVEGVTETGAPVRGESKITVN